MNLLLLAACADVVKDTGDDDSGGYVFHDTSQVVDTDDSAVDTVDTGDSAETGETAETADTGNVDTDAPTLAALDVYPGSMVVHPGATFNLRVVATELDEARADATGATFASDDAAVATVDADGLVTAVAAGTTTLRVDLGGLQDTVAVEVRDDGVVTVTVVDASTGAPIEGARVALLDRDSIGTDASGVAQVAVPDGGPLVVSAWGAEDTYASVTIAGTVSRVLTLPLWPKDLSPDDASVSGALDFTGVDDGAYTDAVIGFASASVQGELGALRLEDLFAEERSISVYGIDVDAPSNLFMEGVEEGYVAGAHAGPVGAWGLAGPIPIADVTSGLSGSGDALRLLVDHLPDMAWGYAVGGTASLGAVTSMDLAPGTPFDDALDVPLPALPAGFGGTEGFFVLTTDERADEGFVGTGLGMGSGTLSVSTVAEGTVSDSLGTAVLAYAQVDGLGSGGPTSSVVGRVGADGSLAFPEMLDIATLDTWDPATRTLGVTVDPDAQFVRVRLVDNRQRVADLIVAGAYAGEVPRTNADFGMARATVEVRAFGTVEGTFEEWVAEGVLDPGALPVVAAARTTSE